MPGVFAYRWFTTNLIHGHTKNPRDPGITPGGSSGGAGASVAAGIGHIAHGTDIAGSIRYPAYACGVHGLRPTVGRIPAFNASVPERTIGAAEQRGLRSARAHRRRSQDSAGGDVGQGRARYLVGAGAAGRPSGTEAGRALPAPDGLETVPEVKAALVDAARRLERAGWTVEEVEIASAARGCGLQTKLWLGDKYEAQLAAAEREGDPGALACLRGNKPRYFRSTRRLLEGVDAEGDVDARMAAVP